MKTKLLFSLMLLPLAGCVAVAVGAVAAYGVIKVERNHALRDFKSDVETVWTAAQEAMAEAGYRTPKGDQPGATGGKMRADDAWLEVEKIDGEFTRVRVGVGTFETDSNIEKAKGILNGVARRLGETEY